MVDVQMRAEDVVDLLEADAEREQFVAPALLAGKIERRRMALVLAGAGVNQNGVTRRAHDKRLIGDNHHAARGVEHLRLHRRQMVPEHAVVIRREKILRPPPRPFPLDHRIDGNVADPQLLHAPLPIFLKRNERVRSVQGASAQACTAEFPSVAQQRLNWALATEIA